MEYSLSLKNLGVVSDLRDPLQNLSWGASNCCASRSEKKAMVKAMIAKNKSTEEVADRKSKKSSNPRTKDSVPIEDRTPHYYETVTHSTSNKKKIFKKSEPRTSAGTLVSDSKDAKRPDLNIRKRLQYLSQILNSCH